ncbi:lysine-arginine-ornithine-binding periplasmic protein [Oligella urethralis]|uniref:transporter substrate-binding domain-containing protein n=1 Tax=Oligella urethralis TaxID=90245 RepID=UPI000378B7EE|nr:transporter substrate-binding domain-containing protein [Oligella urethralis]SUA62848.1 lysine-arginine-ornithine-binding periplasmic protein [Oligella urethralis]SUA64574.1 lysine-arginine-ornithine-binding periplasmic protein [Oligella urethralis]
MQDQLDLKKVFAPTGELRAVINLGNAILAKPGTEHEVVRGVSVDLAKKFALQLGLPLKLIPVKKAAEAVNYIATGNADIGFFAIDPERAELVSFTQPYVVIQGGYMVPQHSSIQSIEEVDHKGNRVVVGQGSAYDLHLSRSLKHAEIIRAASSQEVVDHFLAHGYEVAAGVKQQLELDAARVGSAVRILPGHFMEIPQAMGVAKQRGDLAADYLNQFVQLVKASGEVQQILDANQAQGAIVAK